MSQHKITLTLSPGVRTNLTITSLLWQMLPHKKRGDEQKFIRTAIVTLHQAHFKHLRLTLGEYLADLCEKFGETQTSVLRAAIAFHAGKHNNQATRSNPAAQPNAT